ncbi:MAG: ABC transporter permease [Turicibacter sp.]|nr:ABC transporter permease [Turicibacter sp.]
MNFLKRATTSMKRQPVKFTILFLLIFILSTVISGAISVTTAITNTEAHLRRQMRPMVVFEVDHEAVNDAWEAAGGYWDLTEIDLPGGGSGISSELAGAEWPTIYPITTDMIRQIADLSQVDSYHYAITARFITRFVAYLPAGIVEPNWGGSMTCMSDQYFECFEESIIYNPTDIVLRGTSEDEPLELREGLIDLVVGNHFGDHTLRPGSTTYPALVSSGFAQANGFSIGSIFTLESGIHRRTPVYDWEDFFFDQREHEFEVIGLFDVVPLETDDEEAELNRQRELANRVFTVNAATEAIQLFEFEGNVAAAEEADEQTWFDAEHWGFDMEITFMLTDPQELASFRDAVADYLPEFWVVRDLTGSFDHITASMDSLGDVADGILFATAGAAVLVLSLLITLFLKDRRHEIGIYLALGERKSRIISQILCEVLITALIGLTFAMFVGHAVSANISREIMRSELAQPVEQEPWMSSSHFVEWEDLGFGTNLTLEGMVEAFDTSLDLTTIALMSAAGLGVAVVSTLIPVVYVVKLKPKKVLL